MDCARKFTTGLAVASVLFTGPVWADDENTIVTTEAVIVNTAEASRERAAEATAAAAKAAVDTLLSDTRLDLDIRLIGPTSVKIARDR